jgi:RNA polymerase sigma-70 factor (sigma-E family)
VAVTEHAGFDEFVLARGDALLRHAYLLCGDRHWAQDLLQDALVKAHGRWRRVSSMEHPEAYVRQIIVNGFLTRRRQRSSGEIPVADLVDSAARGDHAAAHAARNEMWSLLATLPRQQRAAVVLRFYEDLDDQAIGHALGCGSATVRKHVQLALAKLKPHFDTAGTLVQEQDQHG